MNKVLATSTAIAFAATTSYLVQLFRHISTIANDQITSSDVIPTSLETSKARSITNPKCHIPITDTRWVVIKAPANLGDEAILARFVNGFFGGYVFGPERTILQAAKPDLVNFSLLKGIPVSTHIWSATELTNQKLPPLHSVIFGAFRIVDCKIEENDDGVSGGKRHSYVDFAFGSDDGALAGVHRFSVWRNKGSGGENVKIEFAHTGCNPRKDERLKPEVLQTLHLVYAKLLFREGMAKVLEDSVDESR